MRCERIALPTEPRPRLKCIAIIAQSADLARILPQVSLRILKTASRGGAKARVAARCAERERRDVAGKSDTRSVFAEGVALCRQGSPSAGGCGCKNVVKELKEGLGIYFSSCVRAGAYAII